LYTIQKNHTGAHGHTGRLVVGAVEVEKLSERDSAPIPSVHILITKIALVMIMKKTNAIHNVAQVHLQYRHTIAITYTPYFR